MLTLIVLPAVVGVLLLAVGVVAVRPRRRPADDFVAPPVDLDFLRASPWQEAMATGFPLAGRRALPATRPRGRQLKVH